MQVRLTLKLANVLDGVDVSAYEVGDVLELTSREAELLIAEGWAEPHEALEVLVAGSSRSDDGEALRNPAPSTALVRAEAKRLCEVWERPGRQRDDDQDRRRAEDIVRDELRDSRARTIRPEKG